MATKALTRAIREVQEQQTGKNQLLDLLGDQRTIYTILRTVSASGMSRTFSLKIIKDNDLWDVTYLAAKVLGNKCITVNGYNSIRINGAGMDMGFYVVYNLSSILFRDSCDDRAGYELRERAI